MSKREIKKTLISYQQTKQLPRREKSPERSRQKKQTVEVVDATSRRARLAMLKSKRNQEEEIKASLQLENQPTLKITTNLLNVVGEPQQIPQAPQSTKTNLAQPVDKKGRQEDDEENDMKDEEDYQQRRVLLKPVYIPKEDRSQDQTLIQDRQQQRKKKALRYTTKLLLLENAKDKNESDDEIVHSSDDENETNLPDDDDNKNQQYEYELWKIRELKRIRRDREERRKIEVEKAEIERRRKMNNEEILLENKVMGSDATDNPNETKYVFMQKYYHKGAFYQDSQDPIFKRDYNLPTPLQMQDKSMLPEILQSRKGNFGKKGQSKYKHLTAEDTTNFDPQFRADQSILASWKKKMAGYKGSKESNI